MTKGAQVVTSAGRGAALRPCQCACGPSPSVDTMPTPVIQASRGRSAAGSAIGQRLHREGERGGGFFHVLAELRVRELDHAERDLRVAGELAVEADLGLGAREARAFMLERGGEPERVAGLPER